MVEFLFGLPRRSERTWAQKLGTRSPKEKNNVPNVIETGEEDTFWVKFFFKLCGINLYFSCVSN